MALPSKMYDRPRSVLVVDDDPETLGTYRRILSSIGGYDVVTAAAGREGLEVLRRGEHLDLVLADLRMEDLSGLEMLAHIHEHGPNVPVVIMTAFSMDGSEAAAKALVVQRTVTFAASLVAVCGAFACSGVQNPSTPTTLLNVSIQSCPGTLVVGQSSACRAIATFQGGVSTDVSLNAVWSSTNPSVASSHGIGLVIANAIGQTVVSATYQGKAGALNVSVTGGQDDMLRNDAVAQQGPFHPGNDVTFWLSGFYSVVSGPTGELSIQVSDQNGVIAVAPTTVVQGGDLYLLTAKFTIPLTSTRVCPVAVLAVGSSSISVPSDSLRYCVSVTP